MFYEDEDFGLNKSVDYLENNCFSATGENCFQRFFMKFYGLSPNPLIFLLFHFFQTVIPDHTTHWTTNNGREQFRIQRTNLVRFGTRPGPVLKKMRALIGLFRKWKSILIKTKKRIKKIYFSEFENSMNLFKNQTMMNHQILFFMSSIEFNLT